MSDISETIQEEKAGGDDNASRDEKTSFKLEQFEGPLDLLLFLIKKSEINIYDIPISQITEQFIAYLERGENINLDNLTEFYVMASTLLFIKSKMLLPVEVDLDEEFEDPRQELVDRLIEYQKFKKFTDIMEERERQAEWQIQRRKKQRILPFPEDEEMWEQIDVWDLLQTFSTIITSLSSERIIDLYEEVSVNEKISLMHELLEQKSEFLFTDLIVRPDSTLDLICAFLAVLESVKLKTIAIFQNRMFGDIRIRKSAEKIEDGTAE